MQADAIIGERIRAAVMDGRNRVIMVIGGPDTGKTTLAESIIDLASRQTRTGVVDLDMGQSHIGPPTTLAWGAVADGFKGWDSIAVEGMYFTGALSPPGNLLPAIVGARRMLDMAIGCEKAVIDTTGLVSGPLGRVLKQFKIDSLRPDIILALERQDELAPILDAFRSQKRPLIYRVPALKGARAKDIEARSAYRAGALRSYFAESRIVTVDNKKTAFRYMKDIHPGGLQGIGVSFRDADGADLAIGVIEEANPGADKLSVRTPLEHWTRFATLVIGSAAIDFKR